MFNLYASSVLLMSGLKWMFTSKSKPTFEGTAESGAADSRSVELSGISSGNRRNPSSEMVDSRCPLQCGSQLGKYPVSRKCEVLRYCNFEAYSLEIISFKF